VKLSQDFLAFDFAQKIKAEHNPRKRSRLFALSLLQKYKCFRRVGAHLKVHPQSVSAWLKKFLASGLAGLDENSHGRPQRFPKEQEAALKEAVLLLPKRRSGGRITAESICNLIAEEFSISYSVPGVYHLLERLNIVWITGRARHPKTNLATQEEFKKNSKAFQLQPYHH
jgi:transposase